MCNLIHCDIAVAVLCWFSSVITMRRRISLRCWQQKTCCHSASLISTRWQRRCGQTRSECGIPTSKACRGIS